MHRSIVYIHVASAKHTLAELSSRNWLALVYVHEYAAKQHDFLLEDIISANPLFVYGVTKNFVELEDAITQCLVEITGDFDDDAVLPLVYADDDLPGALDFSVHVAFHETKDIEEIYILDCNTEKMKDEDLQALMQKVR